MKRQSDRAKLIETEYLAEFGLKPQFILGAIDYLYDVLDRIDTTLQDAGSDRLSQLLELANLSAIVGNLFRRGITRTSKGAFIQNKPHTYPDLIGVAEGSKDIEIKVALETNKPKGHLVKPGPHVTLRYVLADQDGNYRRGRENRGDVVWVWEIRTGILDDSHFRVSNTEGDSGKTAVISADGMDALEVAYCDILRCPHSPSRRRYQDLEKLYSR
ncbi:MAG TPA: hypothetical protein VM163_06945 [bacterium]|nr:hypothetical protein [bacterium]